MQHVVKREVSVNLCAAVRYTVLLVRAHSAQTPVLLCLGLIGNVFFTFAHGVSNTVSRWLLLFFQHIFTTVTFQVLYGVACVETQNSFLSPQTLYSTCNANCS